MFSSHTYGTCLDRTLNLQLLIDDSMHIHILGILVLPVLSLVLPLLFSSLQSTSVVY
jgi:hypothetical protein